MYLLLLVAGLFEYVWTPGIVSKYYIKFCHKSNQVGEWNSIKVMSGTTPLKFLYVRNWKFRTKFQIFFEEIIEFKNLTQDWVSVTGYR